MSDYDNIPVSKKNQTYAKVKMIAESKGFGKRGAGALIDYWVAREIAAPVCEHEKQPVEVQYFPGADVLTGALLVRQGWFCPTCNRVYPNDIIANMETEPVKKAIRRAGRTA